MFECLSVKYVSYLNHYIIMKTAMKALLALVSVSSVAMAGEPSKGTDLSKEVLPVYDNPYFIGGTFGYLDEMDTEFYSFHVGKDLTQQLHGWDQSVYLEVGYAETDFNRSFAIPRLNDNIPAQTVSFDYDFEIIPVTLNYKLEKVLNQKLNFYMGVGAGVGFTDSEVSTGGIVSGGTTIGAGKTGDSDAVFFSQAFLGLLYNINPSWEAYGGARFIYFEDPDSSIWDAIEDADEASNTDWLGEIGLRYNF